MALLCTYTLQMFANISRNMCQYAAASNRSSTGHFLKLINHYQCTQTYKPLGWGKARLKYLLTWFHFLCNVIAQLSEIMHVQDHVATCHKILYLLNLLKIELVLYLELEHSCNKCSNHKWSVRGPLFHFIYLLRGLISRSNHWAAIGKERCTV